MANIILGVIPERRYAEEAIAELEEHGYNPKDISIMMKDSAEYNEIERATGAGDIAGGAVSGAGTGAVLGGLAGLLAGTVLPGLGGFLIGGPIGAALGLTGAAATTVSGAVTGAAAGGIIGALTSTFGLSDEDARTYETRINEGGILVAVPAMAGDEQEVRDIMSEYGAYDIKDVEASDYPHARTVIDEKRHMGQPAYYSEVKGGHGDPKRHVRAKRRG